MKLPISPDRKYGGSSFTNATKRIVCCGVLLTNRRARARVAATPVPLSFAPGEPNTESECAPRTMMGGGLAAFAEAALPEAAAVAGEAGISAPMLWQACPGS